ncbi:caspase-2-like [Ptychodera flava]|uniref:caspase-2-like n=1 Tax=Ptychodera flava TaxID=63121 RepID=UPI003969E724
MAYGLSCTEGTSRRKENSRTQGAATQGGELRKGPCMPLHHQDLLRKHKEQFAKDLPYQRVLDHMSDVFSLEDESEIKKDSLSDFNKRRTLIDILLTKGPEAFPKFVKVLERECPHLAKALKAEPLRNKK